MKLLLLIAVPLLIAAGVGVGSFVPLAGQFDVSVTVGVTDLALLFGNYYSVSITGSSTLGPAHLIDWTALGLGFSGFSWHAQYQAKVCVANQCSTKQEGSWLPTVPVLNGQQLTASDTFKLAYVPGGVQSITVELDQNGASVATAGGSMCVGC